MADRRLFFALWPCEALRIALADVSRSAVLAAGGRAVPQENLHVTLAFLGSVAQERIPELESIAGKIVARDAGVVPLALTLTSLECWKKLGVLCAAVAEPPAAVENLASALRSRLALAGFTPDLKPFRAHVTLARKIARPLDSLNMRPMLWSFTGFALVESRTEPRGAVYEVLKSFPYS